MFFPLQHVRDVRPEVRPVRGLQIDEPELRNGSDNSGGGRYRGSVELVSLCTVKTWRCEITPAPTVKYS
jgi:hypothetical protein